MSACSKETNMDLPRSDKTASVRITVLGTKVVSTKASGTLLPTPAEENVIKNVTVGLFKTDGTTDVISEGTLTDGHITVTGTGGERQVVVVANAASGVFAGALTKAEFLARTVALTQTKSELPMSGEGTNNVTLVAGATKAPEIDIVVSRLVARIQLESLKTDFSAVGQYANAAFTLDKVFVYNVMSKSQVGVVSSATTLVTSGLIHGWEGAGEGAATIYTSLVDKVINTVIPAVPASAYTIPYYFYVFQNYFADGIDNTNRGTATKLVIAGWFTPNKNVPNTKYYVYYPAVINRTQSGTNISGTDNTGKSVNDISNKGVLRNSIYSVAATIKNIGVNSPADFMEPTDLDLGVTVADWALTVTQKVNF